jgi:hypothetical protein
VSHCQVLVDAMLASAPYKGKVCMTWISIISGRSTSYFYPVRLPLDTAEPERLRAEARKLVCAVLADKGASCRSSSSMGSDSATKRQAQVSL